MTDEDKRVDVVAEHVREVGFVCSGWAHLEFLFEVALWWLVGLPKAEGRVLTSGLSLETLARKVCDRLPSGDPVYTPCENYWPGAGRSIGNEFSKLPPNLPPNMSGQCVMRWYESPVAFVEKQTNLGFCRTPRDVVGRQP
jgi:hypothetical protein